MDAATCRIDITEADGILRISAAGAWETARLAAADRALRDVAARRARIVRIDLSHIDALDTAGAWLIYRTLKTLRAQGIAAEITEAKPDHRMLVDGIAATDREQQLRRPQPHTLMALLDETGRAFVHAVAELGGLLSFLGVTVVTGARALAHPRRFRLIALFVQMERGGLNALPIVGLLSFLIGVVLAYQGADQLRRFGA